MTANVDFSSPPPPLSGDKLPIVSLRCGLWGLSNINTHACTADIDFNVILTWTDMRLSAYDGLDLPGNLWTPEVCIVNHLSGPDEGAWIAPAQFLGPPTNCRLKKWVKYKTTVRNPFDNLVSFPFDLDQISAEFYMESDFRLNDRSASGSSTGARTYQLALLKDGDSEGKPVRLHVWNGEVNEWDILAVSMELNECPADERGCEGTYFTIELHASRKSMYYVWKAILPLHLLSVLSFTGMALDVDDYSSRAGLLATFLLAALVMLFVIGDYLPRTDFLTNIDLVTIISVVTIAALLVASTVLSIMADFWSMDALLQFNRFSTFIVAIVYLLVNVVIVLIPNCKKKKAIRELFQKGRKKALSGTNLQVAPSSPDEIRRFVFQAFPDVHRDKPRVSWLKEVKSSCC